MAEKFRIKKGDKVVVITGRDKGKKGEVLSVLRAERRAVVSGVNVVKRHTRPVSGNPGGIIEKEAPIQISNLAIQDPRDGHPTRIGFRFLDDGRKVRFAKRSGEVLDL
jgi:large subunit ribosomal protein L24